MSFTAGSEPLTAIIIGCGAIAGGYDEANESADILTHAKAYSAHPLYRIAACVEPDDQLRQRFMTRWNVPVGYRSLDQAEGAFDVASVCAPTPAHATLLDALLDMKVRLVFAEKPLTSDLAASRALVAAYAEANRPIAVNYLRRWAAEIRSLKQEIEAGHWGALHKAICLYTKGFLNNGSHAVDLLRFLFGELSPVEAFGRIDDGRDDDPTLDVRLKSASGAPVLFEGLNSENFTLFEITLYFDNGRVALTDSGFEIVRQSVTHSARFAGYRVLDRSEAKPTGLNRAMMGALDNIHAHLAGTEPLASDGASALAAHEICASAALLRAGSTLQGAVS
jgi:predicted dehydrogenase